MGKRPEQGTLGHNPFENLGAIQKEKEEEATRQAQAEEQAKAEAEQAEIDTQYNDVLAGRYNVVGDLAGKQGIVFTPDLQNIEYAILNKPSESDSLNITLVYKGKDAKNKEILKTATGAIYSQKKEEVEQPVLVSIRNETLTELGVTRNEILKATLEHLETINIDRSIIIDGEILPTGESDNDQKDSNDTRTIDTQEVRDYNYKLKFFDKSPDMILRISTRELGLYDGNILFLFPNFLAIENSKYGKGAYTIGFSDTIDSLKYSQMLLENKKDEIKDELSKTIWFDLIKKPKNELRKIMNEKRETGDYSDGIEIKQFNHSHDINDKNGVKKESLERIKQEGESSGEKMRRLKAEAIA